MVLMEVRFDWSSTTLRDWFRKRKPPQIGNIEENLPKTESFLIRIGTRSATTTAQSNRGQMINFKCIFENLGGVSTGLTRMEEIYINRLLRRSWIANDVNVVSRPSPILFRLTWIRATN